MNGLAAESSAVPGFGLTIREITLVFGSLVDALVGSLGPGLFLSIV